MTGPFQTVLSRIPKGVLAGLFWYMGTDALAGSGVTALFLFLIRDRHLTSPTDPLHRVRKSRVLYWLIIELIGFGATFAITQTIAAIGGWNLQGSDLELITYPPVGFPVVITALIPIRVWIIPRLRLFTEDELNTLDGPVASAFTMASVGGSI
jgi:hypothetical protein